MSYQDVAVADLSANQNASSLQSQIAVSDADALAVALKNASAGDVIRLVGGDYGKLNLKNFTTPVTLLADPDDPAVFNWVKFTDVSGVTFDGVTFDYTYSEGQADYVRPFRFTDCADIAIRNAVVSGDNASGTGTNHDGHGYGTGLRFERCDGVSVTDSNLFGFGDNIQVSASSNVVITGNEIHHMRSDGIQTGGTITGMLIENNHFHSTQPRGLEDGAAAGSADHPDFIQAVGGIITDLTIRSNWMEVADVDGGSQGIFLPNKDKKPWQNITIDNNLIISNSGNGIIVGVVDELTVSNNTVLRKETEARPNSWSPKIVLNLDSTDVTDTGNIAVNGDKDHLPDDWTVANNFDVQNTDPTAENYYAEHFTDEHGTLRTDSPITEAGVNHSLLPRLDAEGDELPPEDDVLGPENAALQIGTQLLELDTETGAILLGEEGETVLLEELDPGALTLRDLEKSLYINRSHLSDLSESESIQVDLRIGRDEPGHNGQIVGDVFRLQGSMTLTVTRAGELKLSVHSSDDIFHRLQTSGFDAGDGEMHDISISYTVGGDVVLMVDGTIMATDPVNATLAEPVGNNLVIGGAYGLTPFGGKVESFSIKTDIQPPEAPDVLMATLLPDTPVLEGEDSFEWAFSDGETISDPEDTQTLSVEDDGPHSPEPEDTEASAQYDDPAFQAIGPDSEVDWLLVV